eukprot:scaffold10894_cov97-Skeletonema_dohrnii-CCMP3373.AAC.3
MGYDANIKSKRAVKQQRLTIVFTLIGLALACTFAVNFLRRPKNTPVASKNGSGQLQQLTLRKKQEEQFVAGASDGKNNDKLL